MQLRTPISLAADSIGADLLPVEELADCAQVALARDGKTVLSYGAGGGYVPLRELIGQWFGVHPYNVVLTNGRLQGLGLLTAALPAPRSVAVAPSMVNDCTQRAVVGESPGVCSQMMSYRYSGRHCRTPEFRRTSRLRCDCSY